MFNSIFGLHTNTHEPSVSTSVSNLISQILAATGTAAALISPTPVPTEIPKPVFSPIPEDAIHLGNELWLVTDHQEDYSPNQNMHFNADIPQLTGGKEAVLDTFNRGVYTLVTQAFDQTSQDLGDYRIDDPGGFIDITYKIIGSNQRVLSILMLFDSYTGGAHPFAYHRSLNYDLKAGKFIDLSELFIEGEPYLESIAGYCIDDLKSHHADWLFEDFENQGAAPSRENYSVWNLSSLGLVVTFEEYQIAPYAVGYQQVVIPYSEVYEILDRDGPVSAFYP